MSYAKTMLLTSAGDFLTPSSETTEEEKKKQSHQQEVCVCVGGAHLIS